MAKSKKKTGAGIGILALIIAAIWFFTKRAEPALAVEPEVPEPFQPPVPPPGFANLYGRIAISGTTEALPDVLASLDGLQTYTDANGNFVFASLTPGAYHLMLEKSGFPTMHSSRSLREGENRFFTYMKPVS